MESNSNNEFGKTAKERLALFLEYAGRSGGTTAQEVYEKAVQMGDTVTIEAFHNLGRRLAHRGVLIAKKQDRQTFYFAGSNIDGQWLDEEQLASIIDPAYPLIALAALRESMRQLHQIPESVWIELRERLKSESARDLFRDAIIDYADNFRDELQNYLMESEQPESYKDLPKMKQQLGNILAMLKGLTKFGMGLSEEAIGLPSNIDDGLQIVQNNPDVLFYDEEVLKDEIGRRVTNEPMIVETAKEHDNRDLLVAAVDGSTRGGLLSFQGEEGDLAVGHAPMVSVNTSVAQINRSIKIGNQLSPAFMRLPEKPEDMQQQSNRYTIMAKVFYPDLSDSEYAHSVWNAMDVLESRAALRVMSRWYTSKTNLEIMPADVVMRDGTITPNDRDFYHYKDQNSYGQIVRDLVETNWEIAKKCRDDGQTLCGVVKNAQLKVLTPVINWFACKLAAKEPNSQLIVWPLRAMNMLSDQILLTRILTSGIRKGDPWHRTCLVLRPFHATTNFAQKYSRSPGKTPSDQIISKHKEITEGEKNDLGREDQWFWTNFRGDKDVYIQMLQNVWYAGFYLGLVPRLDIEKTLPRLETLIVKGTEENGSDVMDEAGRHLQNCIRALQITGFDVSSEHSMFASAAKIDVLPSICVAVHDTVKIWATELLSRVQEYIGYHLSKYYSGKKQKVRIRRWSGEEMKSWVMQMQKERNEQAGIIRNESRQDSDLFEK